MTEEKMKRQQINRWQIDANYSRSVHQARLEYDTTLAEIMAPGYWGAVWKDCRKGDKIEAFREDYSLDVTLRVTQVEAGLVYVQLHPAASKATEESLKELKGRGPTAIAVEQAMVPEELMDDYKIGFTPNVGFYALYKPTKTILLKGQAHKDAAINKALAHRKAALGVAA